jgi:formylglycine-generating enzyme required for sulfatase activity
MSGAKHQATWSDPVTGLEWQCESAGRMSWHAAQEYARSLRLEGRTDWRLPTVRELETLLDRRQYRPEMRTEIPFRDRLSYWSSTTFGPHRNNAWIVMFDGAYVLSYYKTNLYHVRCLRGQQMPGCESIHREEDQWQSTR